MATSPKADEPRRPPKGAVKAASHRPRGPRIVVDAAGIKFEGFSSGEQILGFMQAHPTPFRLWEAACLEMEKGYGLTVANPLAPPQQRAATAPSAPTMMPIAARHPT